MATRKELIYDVKTILEASNITDDSKHTNRYIGYKIDQRRAKEKRDSFSRNPAIEPIWLQDLGITDLIPVNKAEDRTISICECKFSKTILPPVVMLHDAMSNHIDVGTTIRSICGSYQFNYMPMSHMGQLTNESVLFGFKYFTKVGNSYYLTTETNKCRPVVILESPLDGFVNDNTIVLSGKLIQGLVYEVSAGNITYNGVKRYKGATFTATSTLTFTGNGHVVLQNQKRQMTDDDEYPMSATMANRVIMALLTEDYGIEAKKVEDIKNNSAGPFKSIS
jgi:hypothetical protein